MHIGFVTTSYPMTSAPIAGVFVRSLARALVDAGHTVEVLAPEPARGGPLTQDPGVEVRLVRYAWPRGLGRTFYGAGVPDNIRSASAWPGLLSFPPALVLALRRRRWNAVVSHWALPCALAVQVAAPNLPHVAFLHSADVRLLEKLPLRGHLACALARSARALAFSSDDLRQRFERVVASARGGAAASTEFEASVVPIGTTEAPVDPGERRAARAALGTKGLVVLALARQVGIKGLDVAIDAVGETRDVTLVLAGDGPERERLVERARRARAQVVFPGVMTGAERRRWLAAADVLVVPSRVTASGRTEGAPTAIFEALAAGCPVVASEVGGIGETVTSDNGVLVRPDDPAALRRALELLRDAPERLEALRLGARRTRVPRPARAASFVLDAVGARRSGPDEDCGFSGGKREFGAREAPGVLHVEEPDP